MVEEWEEEWEKKTVALMARSWVYQKADE